MLSYGRIGVVTSNSEISLFNKINKKLIVNKT